MSRLSAQPLYTNGTVSAIPSPGRFELGRTRALEYLQSESEAQVLVICAPMGYGKTTFAAQYARSCGQPVYWFHLTASDHDLENLQRCILKVLAPDQAPQDDKGLALLALLGKRLGTLPSSLLVFDGCEHLGQTAETWLEQAIRHQPKSRFMLIGTRLPRIGLPNLLARGSAIVLDEQKLKFDTTESVALLRARGIEGDLEAIHQKIDGWPVGAALVNNSETAHLGPASLLHAALANLPAALHEALKRLSVLELWNVSSAQALSVDLPPDWYQTLRNSGLPVVPLVEESCRPHRLLQQVLQSELQQQLSVWQAFHRKAARLQRDAGNLASAVHHHLIAGDTAEAVHLAEPLAVSLEMRLEDSGIIELLADFAPSDLTPTLRAVLGLALFDSGNKPDVTRGETLIRDSLVMHPDHTGTILAHAYTEIVRGRCAQALPALEQLLDQLPAEAHERVRALRYLTLALDGLGDQRRLDTAEQALKLAYHIGEDVEIATCLTMLASILGGLEQHERKEHLLMRALVITQRLSAPGRLVYLMNQLANAQHALGRSEQALSTLEKAAQIAAERAPRFLAMLHGTRGRIHRLDGRFDKARFEYQRVLELAHDRTVGQSIEIGIELWVTELDLRYGQVEQARQVLETLAYQSLSPKVEQQYALRLAQLACMEHRLEDAVQHLRHCLELDAQPEFTRRAQALLSWIKRGAQTDDACLQGTTDAFILGVHGCSLTASPEEATPALHIRTLGEREVRTEQHIVKIPLAKSFELLVWLCKYGPSTRETLIDALWDGSNDPRCGMYFKVAVRRLRTSLSEVLPQVFGPGKANPIPLSKNRYRLHPKLQPRLDSAQILAPLENDTLELLERRLEGYSGSFMPGIDSEWVCHEREHLFENALQTALRLGQRCMPDNPQKAIWAFERALRLDPLLQEAHLGLIAAFEQAGETTAAARAHRTFARTMLEEFGEIVPDRSSA